MPPKLTSKNIFDVLFDELPADAFIDTGPASLKEELMLEAAGMLSSTAEGTGGQRSAQRGGTNAANGSGGGGGPTSYRRHLLPSAFVAATAAIVRSSGRSAPAASEDTAGAAAAEQWGDLQDADVLDAEDLDDGTSSPLTAHARPPAYTLAPARTTEVSSGSVFRRVDDEVDGGSADHFAARRRGIHDAHKRRDGGCDVTDAESGFDLQMNAEDDAVKEATKYAGCVAEIQATEKAGTEQQTAYSGQPVGGGSKPNLPHARPVASSAGAGIGPGVGVVRCGTGLSVSDDAAAEGTVPATVTSVTAQATAGIKTGVLVEAGASSAAVSGAAGPHGEGPIDDQALPSYAQGRSQARGTGHAAVSGGQTVSAAGGPLLQRPFGVARAPQRGGTLTAAEQLALMPPGLDRVYTGACVMYRHPKNFGFVSPDVGGPDVFFIISSIALSFTRLALRAFYLRSGMPVPPSVAAAYRVGAANDSSTPTGGDGAPISGTTTAMTDAATAADASSTAPAEVSALTPAFPRVAAGVTAARDGQATIAGAVLNEVGVLGATPVSTTRPADAGDRVSIPPTTAEELAWAETAASLLTSATARLLQYQVDQGIGGGLRVGDRMSFIVTRNHAARGGNGRLLRAEFIRGVPAVQLAMPLEQSWFHPLFPGAIGQKTSAPYGAPSRPPPPPPPPPPPSSSSAEGGGREASSAVEPLGPVGSTSTALTRYTGCVRTYDAEEQRGYIRCDESDGSGGSNTPDVIFYAHSVLWDLTRCPPLKRQVKESMRLAYSVCGTERNGKYIATLITNPDGEPFCEENMTFAQNVLPFFMADGGGPSRRRGRGEDGGGVGSGRAVMGTDGGAGASAEDVGGDRKRVKAAEDDMLLLYAEDDYPFM
ncbi:conserved hypothetical protein [Leishmania major strain Friedlin]|uniref:Uncharacterized protein n=1 Tax=Leishmania major TaxID=5664 RepID=Q4QGH1_LEIMA|nr:conserved hypothetical protein [Leishmania major strain Friedlin]CAG9570518.1 hypothetical_protein_-_conserved [Leishmania major strain Friedlin]CAJ03053.1 conserved hypothetical protein [Leishmania major strain Friedlin]|eukprot:XP_001681727.1 conserved hypothetical protein [Leishmania major strain Friedlin]